MIFDWITKRVSDAVRKGFVEALETEPLIRSEPGPPAIEVAAERAIGAPEPASNGKRLTKAAR